MAITTRACDSFARNLFEAVMAPEILLRRAADIALQQPVDAQRIRRRIVRGEAFQRRIYFEPVTAIARKTFTEKRHHRRLTGVRQTGESRIGGSGDAEERHHDVALAAVALIDGVPDGLALLEALEQQAYVVARNCAVKQTFAIPAHNLFNHRIGDGP